VASSTDLPHRYYEALTNVVQPSFQVWRASRFLETVGFKEPTYLGLTAGDSGEYPTFRVLSLNDEPVDLWIRTFEGGGWELRLADSATIVASANDLAYQAVEQLLDLPEPPTALLVCNEKMTGAALACLKDRDVSLPGRLSLVGFDDPPWTAFYRPGITTVRTPRADIAELAFRTLLAELKGEPSDPAVQLVETEFVVRESTAPPGG